MKRIAALAIAIAACISFARAQEYVPTEGNLEARKTFQDNKFGIFIHWGIYSMLGDGEWVLHNRGLDFSEYSLAARGFDPARFNAEEWVKAISSAGAKYITITSRHHDGFSMFGTKASPFNIVDATPFGRDVIGELAAACRKYGIKLHFYYSHLDWGREDYPWGNTGRNSGRKHPEGDWNSYFKFMNTQLTELLTNYGPIGAIWFDGIWDHPEKGFDWHLREQYDLIHSIQDDCLVGNNHHLNLKAGEDIQIFEKDLPGENNVGFSAGMKVADVPLETCATMGHAWGYSIPDQKLYRSADELIREMISAAGRNGNYLLNIGPRPDGCLPDKALDRLAAIGKWMNIYGDTIYGTRGGFIAPHDWGVTTMKDNRLFVHLFKCQDDSLFLPTGDRKIQSAKMFLSGQKVKFTKVAGGIVLALPKERQTPSTVIELNF